MTCFSQQLGIIQKDRTKQRLVFVVGEINLIVDKERCSRERCGWLVSLNDTREKRSCCCGWLEANLSPQLACCAIVVQTRKTQSRFQIDRSKTNPWSQHTASCEELYERDRNITSTISPMGIASCKGTAQIVEFRQFLQTSLA